MLVMVVEMLDLIFYLCARRFTVNEGCGLLGESGCGLAAVHPVSTHAYSVTCECIVRGLLLRKCGQWSGGGEGKRWSMVETARDWEGVPIAH